MQIKWILMLTLAAGAIGFYFQSAPPQPQSTEPHPRREAKTPVKSKTPQEKPEKKAPQRRSKKQTVVKKAAPRPSQFGKYPGLDDSFAPFDDEGNLYVTQITVQGKNLTYHGDLLLGRTKDLEAFKKKKSLKISKPRLWPGGKVPYTIDSSVPHPWRVEAAIDHITDATNVRFLPRSDEKDFVEFTAGEANCYSYVGRVGNAQAIYLAEPCSERDILHELLHVLGFFHEQNRGDRDEFVDILWENIPEVHQLNFKKFPMDFMHLADAPFSMESIMMYPSSAFSGSVAEPTILQKNGDLIYADSQFLSDEDIRRINVIYPQSGD